MSGRRGRAGLSQGYPSAVPDLHTHVHSALLESLINPLQERIEDWKKSVNQLDKDHAKGEAGASAWVSTPTWQRPPTECSYLTPCTEYKRARHEIKKKSSDTLKLQKKARKGSSQRCPSKRSPTGPHSLYPTALWDTPGGHPGQSSPVLGPGPSNMLGGTEGASLHPRPGPSPPLPGRWQEAPQAQVPHPAPGVALSIRLSFTHSFFLSLLLSSSTSFL